LNDFISILLKKENAINVYIFFVKIKIKLAKIKKDFTSMKSEVKSAIIFYLYFLIDSIKASLLITIILTHLFP